MKIGTFEIEAINQLVPNANYRTGDGKIIWDSSDITQPSESDIKAKAKELETAYNARQYQRDRLYPAMGEQLDMLFHDMTAGKGSKDGEWYKAVAKVKSDNPKPE